MRGIGDVASGGNQAFGLLDGANFDTPRESAAARSCTLPIPVPINEIVYGWIGKYEAHKVRVLAGTWKKKLEGKTDD